MSLLEGIPHLPADGMCPVNGVRDVIQWRTGRDWSNEFVHGLGLGGGFAYIRVNVADPPRQVYWGNSTPRQHQFLAELLGGRLSELENRSFDFAWKRAREAVDKGTPPVLGPLDMFHLPYYEQLYHARHIPIHYVLLIGYDDHTAFLLDTDKAEVQSLSLGELRLAWDVNVPGLGKRNRLAVLDVPADIPPSEAVIRKSIAVQCQVMLHPPVSLLGLPAMRKLARELAGWKEELGEEKAARCLLQVREYLNSPPDLEGDRLTAGRDRYIAFLEQAGEMAGLDVAQGVTGLRQSMTLIPVIHQAICSGDLRSAADGFSRVADTEERAFRALSEAAAE